MAGFQHPLFSGFSQVEDGGSPAAVLRVVQFKGDYVGMLGENRVDGAAQGADSFAVDDAHLENPACPAGCQIFRHQVFYFDRLKGMQVEDAVNGLFDRLVHGFRMMGYNATVLHAYVTPRNGSNQSPVFLRRHYIESTYHSE